MHPWLDGKTHCRWKRIPGLLHWSELWIFTHRKHFRSHRIQIIWYWSNNFEGFIIGYLEHWHPLLFPNLLIINHKKKCLPDNLAYGLDSCMGIGFDESKRWIYNSFHIYCDSYLS